MAKNIRKFIKSFLLGKLTNGVSLYLSKYDEQVVNILSKRCFYYLGVNPVIKKARYFNINLLFFLDRRIKLKGDDFKLLSFSYPFFYDVDFINNHHDAWVWHNILNDFDELEYDNINLKESFFLRIDSLKSQYQKCYIFGTGPSLSEAYNFDFSDGYRVVCNTIVKDKSLWDHIRPNLVVAGDALYHFSDSHFAIRFRQDLKKRLSENPDTLFVFPKLYYILIQKEFSELHEQLVPIEFNDSETLENLRINFKLPRLGNVLNLLLLPISISLSKDIYLLGFDGKAPNDNFFWKNLIDTFYLDEFKILVEEHPAFFNHYVPVSEPNKYIMSVHGEHLENELARLENNRYKFSLLSPSYTPTLQKRYIHDRKNNKQ
jgi:hypothetical protein